MAVLLITALCPLIGSPEPVAAEVRPSIDLLPVGFEPNMINNNGQILGWANVDSVWVPAIYANGQVDIIPGGAIHQTQSLSFNDDGQVLVTVRTPENRAALQLRDRSGVIRSCTQPVNVDNERSVIEALGAGQRRTHSGQRRHVRDVEVGPFHNDNCDVVSKG